MPSSPQRIVEICVTSVEAALAAQHGGADRIELCAHLEVGGITPSAGSIAVACRRLSIPVHVLIRPRGGDFTVAPLELDIMIQDIQAARQLGASGVVLGALLPDGRIDLETTRTLVAEASPLPVTFHKAFDATPDPFEALQALLDLGIPRLLTSGGLNASRSAASDSIDRLRRLVAQAGPHLTLLAGGSIRLGDLPALRQIPGLTEIHLATGVLSKTTDCVDSAAVKAIHQAWLATVATAPGPQS